MDDESRTAQNTTTATLLFFHTLPFKFLLKATLAVLFNSQQMLFHPIKNFSQCTASDSGWGEKCRWHLDQMGLTSLLLLSLPKVFSAPSKPYFFSLISCFVCQFTSCVPQAGEADLNNQANIAKTRKHTEANAPGDLILKEILGPPAGMITRASEPTFRSRLLVWHEGDWKVNFENQEIKITTGKGRPTRCR